MRTITAEWLRLRWTVLERDEFTCQYCGQRAPNVQLQVDHRIPVVEGGTDDEDNLVTACFSCNQGKEYSRWSLSLLEATKQMVSVRAPRGIFNSGSKTEALAAVIADRPTISDAELAEIVGVTEGSAHALRYRVKRRLARATK